MKPIRPRPGQESVWDYPRPPLIEACPNQHIRIEAGGQTIVDSSNCWRVLETSHPPVYYIPIADLQNASLEINEQRSFCEWKGQAGYVDLRIGDVHIVNAGWFYPQPNAAFAALQRKVAFYPSKMDACFVDGERVEAQPGDFYGGWITSRVVGPFKGGPGTHGW